MLKRWMRFGRRVRPWMVAVALALGIGLTASCGDDDSGPVDTGNDTISDADGGGEADAVPDAEPDVEPDTEPDGDPDAEPDAEPDADVDPGDQAEAESDCGPAGWYGPMPCESDEQCQTDYGAGWYCDETATVTDPCTDGTISWPVCVEGDEDAGDGG